MRPVSRLPRMLLVIVAALVLFAGCSFATRGAEGRKPATPVGMSIHVAAPSATADATANAMETPADDGTPSGSGKRGRPRRTPPPITPVAPSAVDDEIDPLIDNAPAHVAVVIEQADGTVIYARNAGTQFEAASLYKLGIMVEVYRQREAGLLTFDDPVTLYPGFFWEGDDVYSAETDVDSQATIGDLLENMITLSSNVAAEALLYVVGTDHVNATVAELGMTDTEIRWNPQTGAIARGLASAPSSPPLHMRTEDARRTVPAVVAPDPDTTSGSPAVPPADAYNVTSPNDMALLFRLLLTGRVVSRDASQQMLALLARQHINDRLPADLPDGTQVAHKTGNLDDVVHDAGVIYAPKGPVIVVVMSDAVDDEEGVVSLAQQVGRIAYGVMS